jgi:hypothetical protein
MIKKAQNLLNFYGRYSSMINSLVVFILGV